MICYVAVYWSGVIVCKPVYSFWLSWYSIQYSLPSFLTKRLFFNKNLQCNYLVPVFLEHLLLSVHSEWITFSGNSPSAECFHWCDEQLCWFQPWPLKKRKKISSSQIKEVKRLHLHVQNTFSENLFGSQVKKKSRQSKRQFESQGRQEGGSTYGSLGRGLLLRPSNPDPVSDKNHSFCCSVQDHTALQTFTSWSRFLVQKDTL